MSITLIVGKCKLFPSHLQYYNPLGKDIKQTAIRLRTVDNNRVIQKI